PVYVYNVAKAAVGAAQHFAVAVSENLAVGCPPSKMFETLKIYPNPAHDILHITMLNTDLRDFTFELRDMSGKMISKTQNNSMIDVSGLKPGIYTGTLNVEGQETTKKIIIQ
ncbi:MAG: T9SS type A sorting domain-containing protein, partial [Bergeyella sp.]